MSRRINFINFILRRYHSIHSRRPLPCPLNKKTFHHRRNPVLYIAFLGLPFGKKSEEVEENHKHEVSRTNMSDLTEQLNKADLIFDDNKFKETVELLKSLDQNDANVQWRLARALFKFAGEDENSSLKTDMVREAFKLISEALEKDENNYAIHKWYAILLDAKSNLDGMKERITQLENVKKHMVKAIELNPYDPTSRYILGEFAFGLADLPWYQRKIVSAIFAIPPSATYEEALENFLKAEELKKDFYSMNKLMIAKSYLALKNNEKAKEFLTQAANIAVLNEDDRKCKEEAVKLLSKLK